MEVCDVSVIGQLFSPGLVLLVTPGVFEIGAARAWLDPQLTRIATSEIARRLESKIDDTSDFLDR